MLLRALVVGKNQMIAIDLDHKLKPVIRQYLVFFLAVVSFYWYVYGLVIYMRFLLTIVFWPLSDPNRKTTVRLSWCLDSY